jgi:hypothetical protein
MCDAQNIIACKYPLIIYGLKQKLASLKMLLLLHENSWL